MKKWILPLVLVVMLGACGNGEEQPAEEVKRPLPEAVETVYADYQEALRQGDAEALAALDYAGERTDIPATGAVTRELSWGHL